MNVLTAGSSNFLVNYIKNPKFHVHTKSTDPVHNMKKYALLFIFLGFQTAYSQKSATEIINDFVNATGGSASYDSLQNYTIRRTFRANAPTDFDEEVIVVPATQSMSRRKTLMQRDFFYVVHLTNGWLRIPTGSRDKVATFSVKDLSEKESGAMRQEILDGLWPFLDATKKGYTLQLGSSPATIRGQVCTPLILSQNGQSKQYFFGNQDGLLHREILEEEGQTVTWDHLEYRSTTKGFSYPVRSTVISTRDRRLTQVNTSVLVNTTIPASTFTR